MANPVNKTYRSPPGVPIYGGISAPLTAEFIGSPTSGTIPFTVTYTNQSIGNYTSSSWTFGDGGTSTSQNPTRVFSVPGTYSTALTVTGPGGTSTRTRTAYVTALDSVSPVVNPAFTTFSLSGSDGLKPFSLGHAFKQGDVPAGSGVVVSGINSVVIDGNHGHVLPITLQDLSSTVDVVYTITGTSGHVHTLTLTPAQLTQIRVGQSVTVTSSSGNSHTHTVTVSGVPSQASIKNTWPDGSAKFAVLSGIASLTSGVANLNISSSNYSPTGQVTIQDMKSLVTDPVTFTAGAFGSASWSGSDWDTPFQTWVTGPRMSSWIYRKPIGSDAHLVAWMEVRAWASGQVEVLPWVENGYLLVTSPTNKSATYEFFLGGTARFSAAIDLKHHQRTPLISGTTLSHWLGADSLTVPKHDAAYLQVTNLVPSYAATVSPSATIVTELPTTYTPLQQGSFRYAYTATNPNTGFDRDDMATGGYGPPIGLLPQHDVLPLVTTVNVFASVVRNGFSAGRYHIHYRDETTNRPARFSVYPTLVYRQSQGMKDSGSSTTNTVTPVATGGNGPGWDTAHSPSVGYMAYLLTGSWYFMEEVQFAATAQHFNITDWARGGGVDGTYSPAPGYTGASGICTTITQLRSSAWHFRSLIQALTVTPDNDTVLRNEFINSVEANCNYFHATYSVGPSNPFGFVHDNVSYGGMGSAQAGSIWMDDFVTGAWGYAMALRLPLSAPAQANMDTFFAWKTKAIVGRFGANSSPDWWYVNANAYALAKSPIVNPNYFPSLGATGPWFANWKQMYDVTYPTNAPPMSNTEGLLGLDFNDASSAVRGMWGNLQPALAYAVQHEAPGALEAHTLMVGASNWGLLATQFNNLPVWGVKPATGLLPAWLAGAQVNQIRNFSTGIWPYSTPIIDAWGGLALIDGTGTLVSAANGGHNDSSDNGVYSLDILGASPSWVQRIAPSSVGDRIPNVDYYADGKPISRHGYTHAHYIPQRNRILLFGGFGTWSSGGETSKVDGVNVSNWTWDPAGTWASLVPGRGYGQGRDLTTGNVWTNGGWLWTQATNTWSQPGTQQISSNTRSPWAYDRVLGNFFALQWSDNWGFGADVITAQQFNATTGARTVITFNSSSAATQLLLDKPKHSALAYDSDLDCFYFYSGQSDASGSTVNVPSRIYKITKVTGTVWNISIMSVTGDTPGNLPGAGVNGRFTYVPRLRGVFCLPSGTASPWFMRTS